MASNTQLTWKNFPAGENGFFRAPVMISGASEAVLIDGGFTFSDGKAPLGTEWAGYRFDCRASMDAGDRIVGVGTYHGTYRATGKEMQARVARVWQLQDGEVVAFEQQRYDRLPVFDAGAVVGNKRLL
jgi:hypothetical protein